MPPSFWAKIMIWLWNVAVARFLCDIWTLCCYCSPIVTLKSKKPVTVWRTSLNENTTQTRLEARITDIIRALYDHLWTACDRNPTQSLGTCRSLAITEPVLYDKDDVALMLKLSIIFYISKQEGTALKPGVGLRRVKLVHTVHIVFLTYRTV